MNAFPGIRTSADGIEIDLKVVPGARSDAIVGRLGERLKIRTSAPPEAGKANTAVIKLLARALDVPQHAIELRRGATNPEKTMHVSGLDPETAHARLG